MMRPYTKADREWVRKSNIEYYSNICGFDQTFVDVFDQALDFLESRLDEPSSSYFVAQHDGKPAGCIFLCMEAPGVARIRVFYVAQTIRKRGVGRLLLQSVIARAADNRFEIVRVSTFDRHREAVQLYQSLGFEVTSTAASQAFGQNMQQIDLQLSIVVKRR